MLPAYKITCENGHYWTTSMAAGVTLDDAKKYFLGRNFDTSPRLGDEKFSKVVKVEEIKTGGNKGKKMKRSIFDYFRIFLIRSGTGN